MNFRTDDLYADLETFCKIPLSNGTHAYAEQVEITLFAYAFGDDEVSVWDKANNLLHMGDDFDNPVQCNGMPFELAQGLKNKTTTTVWHNGGGFDRIVLRHAMGIDLPIEKVHDTMVQALAHGLPGALGKLGEIYKIDEDKAKIKNGRKLVMLFCKPRPKKQKLRRATKQTHPKEWAEFVRYARNDVTAMRILRKKMPMWNYQGGERKLWNLDQTINNRGFYVDKHLAECALEAVDEEQEKLAEETVELTEGELKRATQRDAMITHIFKTHNISLPDLKKATVERRLNDPDLPEGLRQLLVLRQQASTTSTSKYKALLKAVSSDGRLRGSLQYCGASRTGRWAGRIFQPQNLPRPVLKQKDIDLAIGDIKNDIVSLTHDNVMGAISSCIRGCICAPEGKKLVVSDLSNIEGRVAAWLAGEDWKLKAFAAYDNGTGPDLYALAYAKSFDITPEEVMDNKKNGNGSMRQIGKVQELALQYQGGVGAFVTFAAGYGIDLHNLADDAYDRIPSRILNEARSFWGWANKQKRTLGMQEKPFVVCDALKRMWREAHPAISSYWQEMENAAIRAILAPNVAVKCRRLTFIKQGAWLRIQLPSGRSVCYAGARVADGKITYMGMNQYSRKWERLSTYGGKLFENVTQALARDIMGHNMPIAEEAGYLTVLTVHDELLTETPNTDSFTHQRLSELLATVPDWAPDIPLEAGGFEAVNYRKD